MSRARPGVMPFHLLMKGEIRVSTAQGDDVTLRPGDLLLLPGGEPHTIWREGDTLALAEPGDGLLPQRGDGGDQVEFLCGEYRYPGDRCGRCCWMPCRARSASRCSPASRNSRYAWY